MGVRVVKEKDVRVLAEREHGRTFCDNEGNWTIVYRDSCSAEKARYIIAHELGHILLGHRLSLDKYIGRRSFCKKPPAEKQADMFAVRLLCPACVIWGLGLSSPQEIAEYCRVEMWIAEQRFERMKILNTRGKYLTDPVERELYEKYSKYIEEARRERDLITETGEH